MESIEELRERVETMEHRADMIEKRLRWWRILACGLFVLGLVTLPVVGGTAQEQSWYERLLARRLAALEYKLQYITGGPNEVVITGANLRIVNGQGSTDCGKFQSNPIPDCPNGLGNLIVGYNELRDFADNTRTGSHNVVVGYGLNFSSFGGLVVGQFNEISGDFSSVSGGADNTASGNLASVSGGRNNTASGNGASVSGGHFNTASGDIAWVSGGQVNTASGGQSSVSGGAGNTASGGLASVSGGVVNTASGLASSVSGGRLNTASGDESSVSGGANRSAPGRFNWAAGPLFAAQ